MLLNFTVENYRSDLVKSNLELYKNKFYHMDLSEIFLYFQLLRAGMQRLTAHGLYYGLKRLKL